MPHRLPGSLPIVLRGRHFRGMIAPNSSFNPNPLRSTNNMAGRACHVVGSTTQVGLTQVLGLMISDSDIARNAIFEILDTQLAQGSPPEVRETLAIGRASCRERVCQYV